MRIGTPEKLGGAEAEYRRPEFATVIGLVIANKNAVQEKNSRKNKKLFSSEESGKKENLLTRLKKSFF